MAPSRIPGTHHACSAITIYMILVCCITLSCRDAAAPAPSSSTGTTPTETASAAERDPAEKASDQPATALTEAGRPEVELLHPGSEPRQRLRYRLQADAEERLSMRIDMRVVTNQGGKPAPEVVMPARQMRIRIRITEMLAPTQARYEFTLEDTELIGGPGIDEAALAAAQAEVQATQGLTGRAFVDDRGFNWGFQMSIGGTVAAGQSEAFDRISSPFPEEAIGRGAKWRLRQPITQNGMQMVQTTVFELVALDDKNDGKKGRLRTKIEQRADRQTMPMAGAATGRAELLRLVSTGEGTIDFDLDRLVPASTLDLQSEYSMRFQTSTGEESVVGANMSMRVEIARQ